MKAVNTMYDFHESGNFHNIQCRYNVIWLKGLKEEARRNLFALKTFWTQTFLLISFKGYVYFQNTSRELTIFQPDTNWSQIYFQMGAPQVHLQNVTLWLAKHFADLILPTINNLSPTRNIQVAIVASVVLPPSQGRRWWRRRRRRRKWACRPARRPTATWPVCFLWRAIPRRGLMLWHATHVTALPQVKTSFFHRMDLSSKNTDLWAILFKFWQWAFE